nr:3-keto-5-aminohexanoate cleavage protein [Marinicella sp. W31]MDC2878043.1 3-keto-5-aminohexanoate cleavage protein [Marinicella sp. W31]
MILQACLNGARPAGYHPKLPFSAETIARDGAAYVAAGAAELHIHPRSSDGRESLSTVSDVIEATRAACPGTLLGVSTGAWIEEDEQKTRDCIASWTALPDYASVNLSEPDAPAVTALLHEIGVGVEAGLASQSDAERFVTLPDCHRAFRILIEIEEQDIDEADSTAGRIFEVLARTGVKRPVLLHGFDATVWRFVERAHHQRLSTRIGLEDGCLLRNGDVANENAELVSQALQLLRSGK